MVEERGPTRGETQGPSEDIPPRPSAQPKQIGPYRILDKLGEGGFGEVYAAEQTEPVRRRVALKVIKAGMDTKAVLARFEAERQALALMDHPNIAKVLDAGETEMGRPYFVMDLIQGEPITTYCDRQRLTMKERLELFIPVCQAIQHAHTKGVIHRDVKPTNVLVTVVDGRPVPRVIDFGIAKATAQSLTEKTLYTLQGQIIGTPAYMSPEQAEMGGLNVDTRTDVYSLGVLLYELLTGTLPFETQTLMEAGIEAMHRVIREKEPPKPSTRISSLEDGASRAAAERRTEPARLTRQVRGELDWITMKALEKDPTRRYDSASGFALDVGRYLRDEPVEASPASAAYRTRKFIRRHRVGVGAASVAVLTLVTFAVTMSFLWQGQRRERERAEGEAARSALMSSFLQDMLKSVSPEETLGEEVTVRYLLDQASERAEEQLADEPAIRAEVQETLAYTYDQLGIYEPGMRLAEASLATRREQYGDEHLEVARALLAKASLHMSTGEADLAEPLLREALALHRQLPDESDRNLATNLNDLGAVLTMKADYAGAAELFREAAELDRKRGDEPGLGESLSNLASCLQYQGDYDAAEPLYEEALTLLRKHLGDPHPKVATLLNNLAEMYRFRGDSEDAERVHGEALAMNRALYGGDHPNVAISLNNLAILLNARGEYDQAEANYVEALGIFRRLVGEEHPVIGQMLNNIADLLRTKGDLDASEARFAEAIALRRKLLGDEHPDVAESLYGLANVFAKREEFSRAEQLYREALAIRETAYGPDDRRTALARSMVGRCLSRLGKRDEAEPFVTSGNEAILSSPQANPAWKRAACQRLVDFYVDWDDAEKSKTYAARLAELETDAE